MHRFLVHIIMMGLISSGFLAVFLSLVFLRQRHKARHIDVFMGVLLTTLAASAAVNGFFGTILADRYPIYTSLPDPFLLLIGPLFFEYIVLLKGGRLSAVRSLIHVLPFIGISIYLIVIGQVNDPRPGLRLLAAIWLAIYIHYWVYYFLDRRLLKQYRQQLKGFHSSLEPVYQAWIAFCLRTLLICYTILGLLFLLQHGHIFLPINQWLAVILALMIYSIAYHILTRPELFAAAPQTQPKDKYQTSGMKAEQVSDNRNRLIALMESRKPFTDPELDLKMLADIAGLSPHHLSQIINTELSMKFYDFVNGYRVEEAKRLLSDRANDRFTVIALAFDAGFNSKATFNRMFKKIAGTTPSLFRRQSMIAD